MCFSSVPNFILRTLQMSWYSPWHSICSFYKWSNKFWMKKFTVHQRRRFFSHHTLCRPRWEYANTPGDMTMLLYIVRRLWWKGAPSRIFKPRATITAESAAPVPDDGWNVGGEDCVVVQGTPEYAEVSDHSGGIKAGKPYATHLGRDQFYYLVKVN